MSDATRQCSYCKQDKPWTPTEEKKKDGSRVYVDEDGRRWSGRRCPDCEKERIKQAVRCDPFERDHILEKLEKEGYTIVSRNLPFRVSLEGGPALTVGIKRASTRSGRIVLESPTDEDADIYALVFESTRICTRGQLDKLAPQFHYHKNEPGTTQSRGGLDVRDSDEGAEV